MRTQFVSTRRFLVTSASLSLIAGAHCAADTSGSPSESSVEGVSGTSAGPIHPFATSSLCLDVVNQSTANGAQVQVWSCSGNANQQWTYDGTSLRVYGTKCLDVTGGSTTNGTKLQIWDCASGNANQAWYGEDALDGNPLGCGDFICGD